MKVLVFGASGKTGGMVVSKAQAAGHDVTAFAHGGAETTPSGVKVLTGDASDVDAVMSAVAGHDAVIEGFRLVGKGVLGLGAWSIRW